jgi:predicted dehydrogenase
MPLKIALVGVGHMGVIHLKKLAAVPFVEAVSVVDLCDSRAQEVAGPYGFSCSKDFSSLLGKVDGAIVATPTDSHFEIARAFLDTGSHVFIEKPIASTTDQAAFLTDLANRKGLILQVGHLERFNPAFQQALSHVRRPIYIETRRLSSFTGRSVDIDVVLDLMIHDIDLVLTLVGEEVVDLRAQGMPFLIDKLDAANVRLEFAGGCVATLNASRISMRRERTVSVFEKDRYYFIDLLRGKLTTCTRAADGSVAKTQFVAEKMDAVEQEISEFISSILSGRKPSVQGIDGLNALTLADRVTGYIAGRASIDKL